MSERRQFILREFPDTPAVRAEVDRQFRAKLQQLKRESWKYLPPPVEPEDDE